MKKLYYFLKNDLTSADLASLGDSLRDQRDWGQWLALLRSEGLHYFAYQRLKDNNLLPLLPPEIARQMENDFYSNVKHNMLYAQALADITSLFQKKNIPVIILKGAFLWERIYHNIGVRGMYDLDILVPRAKMPAADIVLRDLGYETKEDIDFLLAGISPINSAVYAGNGAVIHVHWHLINTTWPLDHFVAAVDPEDIFDQAAYDRLAPEHLVIYFCLHALTHYFAKLSLVLDLAHILRYYEKDLDLEKVKTSSEKWGVWPAVYAALSFVAQCSGMELSGIQAPSSGSWALNYFVKKISHGNRSYILSYALYFFLLPGLACKIKFILRTLFPRRQVMAHSLGLPGKQIRFFHYLKRLLKTI
jgi:hypothetical protein